MHTTQQSDESVRALAVHSGCHTVALAAHCWRACVRRRELHDSDNVVAVRHSMNTELYGTSARVRRCLACVLHCSRVGFNNVG